MEVKKTPKADLENKKLLFREIGLIIALGVVLLAFEWQSAEKAETVNLSVDAQVIEEEIIPVTQHEQAPPPEAPKIPVLSDIIDIVDDDIVVTDNLFIDMEDDASIGVEIMDYVAVVEEEEV